MAQENFVQEGVDRVREVVASLEDDFQRVQKRVEKGLSARRKSFEKQTQKQVKRVRRELRRNSYVKRAQEVAGDATKQFEQAVDSVLEMLQVASRRDLHRIDRKLNQINKKLRDLEKGIRPTAKAS
ncbi:MAG: hypothetical protein ACE5FL_08280 [Myxococcota bacterium]